MSSTAVPFELEILTNAHNYQKWVAHAVMPYMGKRILEVGAGIGNMSQHLPKRELLVLSEADHQLLPLLQNSFQATEKTLVEQVDLSKSMADQLSHHDFDTIVSFNVMEHVENDAEAIAQLLQVLQNSKAKGPKHLITFVPAHQWTFGSLDRVFGHYRRYSKKDFKKIAEKIGFQGKLEARYFNVAGLPGWLLMNRVLKKKVIGQTAIKSFEKICPYVRGIDDFLHKKLHLPLGQSLLVIMRIEESAA